MFPTGARRRRWPDLVAGNVDIMFDNLGVSLALVKGGQLRLLAVATPKRMALAAGRADHRGDAAGLRIGGLVRGGGAAQDAAADRRQDQRRHQRGIAAARDAFAHLAEWSGEAIGGTPQATAAYMREEVERWNKVIKAAGVKLE